MVIILSKWKVCRIFDDKIYKNKYDMKFKECKIWNHKNICDLFVISDTHFFHKKIGEYCGRPHNWQDLIIKRWNQVVGDNDQVLHLGDLTFGSKRKTKEILDDLNGRIYMIKGNHDTKPTGWFDDIGVTLLKKPFVVSLPYRNIRLLFSHREIRGIPRDVINIHGHVHNNKPLISLHENYINTSVEVMNYRPVRIMNLLMKKESLYLEKIYNVV